jgi:hypothetical protein
VYKQAPVPDYFLADFHVVIEWDKLQSVWVSLSLLSAQ